MPIDELLMTWEMCHKRTGVETEVAAQRAVFHLPPQLAADDHQTAREEYEHKEGTNSRTSSARLRLTTTQDRRDGDCFEVGKLRALNHLAGEDCQSPNQDSPGRKPGGV